MDKLVTIAICNFNTTDLTNACIKSLMTCISSFKWKAIVLDNSNMLKFKAGENIKHCTTVLDNTNGKFINFDKVISKFGKSFDETYGSLRHAYSIQFLLNICQTEYMVLLDSDTLAKRDFDFVNKLDSFTSVFDVSQRKTYKKRAVPYIQGFNISKLKQLGIKYFDSNRIRGGVCHKNSALYDTGASFYEDIMLKGAKYMRIDFTDYVFHLRSASQLNRGSKQFINEYFPAHNGKTQTSDLLNYKVIVSVTSWSRRIKDGSLQKTLQSILQQKFNGKIKIALTLTVEEIECLTVSQKQFLDKNNIEIIQATENIKPHKKYFYAMLKWKQLPIITIDDDVIYDDDLVQSLYDSYKEFPECVSARRVHKITRDGFNEILSYRKWVYEDKSCYMNPSSDLFATGIGGVLYPENALHISEADILAIKQCLNADDIFLKKREQELNIKVVHAKGKHESSFHELPSSSEEGALCLMNNTRNRCDNDIYIKTVGLK